MSKRILVQFSWDFGRQGDVDGLFVTTEEKIEAAYGKHVSLGEALGKHSEVYGDLERKDITIVSEDQEFIDKLVALLGTNISGYNPLDHIYG